MRLPAQIGPTDPTDLRKKRAVCCARNQTVRIGQDRLRAPVPPVRPVIQDGRQCFRVQVRGQPLVDCEKSAGDFGPMRGRK